MRFFLRNVAKTKPNNIFSIKSIQIQSYAASVQAYVIPEDSDEFVDNDATYI